MQSHSSSDDSVHTTTVEKSQCTSFLEFAEKGYSPLHSIARKSDDEQMQFTSAAAHYVLGSELTTRIALRAAEKVKIVS